MHQIKNIHGIQNPRNPSRFEEWRDQSDDSFGFEINRAQPQIGVGVSKEVMDSLGEQMIGFVAARMVRWLAENEDAGVERLNVKLDVEVT